MDGILSTAALVSLNKIISINIFVRAEWRRKSSRYNRIRLFSKITEAIIFNKTTKKFLLAQNILCYNQAVVWSSMWKSQRRFQGDGLGPAKRILSFFEVLPTISLWLIPQYARWRRRSCVSYYQFKQ